MMTQRPKEQQHGYIWVNSDLQLSDPQEAIRCLSNAVEDILALNLPLAGIWMLGDVLCGDNLTDLLSVANKVMELLEVFPVPVCYLLGNHEMDLLRVGKPRWPLYELAVAHPQWRTLAHIDDLYFSLEFFGCRVYFLSDHSAPDLHWWTTHGQIMGDVAAYPYGEGEYRKLAAEVAQLAQPAILVSHYAFPGGQRPSDLLGRLRPLPSNVLFHLYGHAHIGDLRLNREYPYRRDFLIAGESIWQYNISALEDRRSAGSHSAFLNSPITGPSATYSLPKLRQWLEVFTSK